MVVILYPTGTRADAMIEIPILIRGSKMKTKVSTVKWRKGGERERERTNMFAKAQM